MGQARQGLGTEMPTTEGGWGEKAVAMPGFGPVCRGLATPFCAETRQVMGEGHGALWSCAGPGCLRPPSPQAQSSSSSWKAQPCLDAVLDSGAAARLWGRRTAGKGVWGHACSRSR